MPAPPDPAPSPDGAATFALSARGLTCRRNERVLFERLDLTLAPGSALALVGRNGAGKTSLLRVLAGLLRPEAGTVAFVPPELAGLQREDDAPLAERSLFVGSRDPLKAALTVRELLAGWQGLLGGGSDALDRAQAAFDLAGLADMPCGYLSSGQRKRVSLARLLLAPVRLRPLWLLDEPTNALDARAQSLLAAAVAGHRARGGLVVVATHAGLGWPGLAELRLGAAPADGPAAS